MKKINFDLFILIKRKESFIKLTFLKLQNLVAFDCKVQQSSINSESEEDNSYKFEILTLISSTNSTNTGEEAGVQLVITLE